MKEGEGEGMRGEGYCSVEGSLGHVNTYRERGKRGKIKNNFISPWMLVDPRRTTTKKCSAHRNVSFII